MSTGPHVRRMIVPIVIASDNRRIKTYAMLDGGATNCIISEKLVSNLKMNVEHRDTRLITIEGSRRETKKFTNCAVANLKGDTALLVTNLLVTDFLTTSKDKPPSNKEIESFKYLEGVKFEELKNKEIGMIISVEHAWTWLGGEIKRSIADKPIAIKTKFGWALAGSKNDSTRETSCFRTTIQRDKVEIHKQIQNCSEMNFQMSTKSHMRMCQGQIS